ncbi:Tyrosine recombinase [Actinidia chinensis var. chinensis]|uniref:Tyrosine recombinase n=1 Tax=Actinidia chinensis var. chinensis TaxID=1590841 RepID=A0A2R6R0J1_ACTCC|nr:Tyrosine recombinase [Actinidia chinensis var. chinensis]
MMNYFRSLAAFVLALVLILHFGPRGAQASRLLLAKTPSSAVASQALKDFQPDGKERYKKVDSSFRTIPPSRSNPTQNKSKTHKMAEGSTFRQPTIPPQ